MGGARILATGHDFAEAAYEAPEIHHAQHCRSSERIGSGVRAPRGSTVTGAGLLAGPSSPFGPAHGDSPLSREIPQGAHLWGGGGGSQVDKTPPVPTRTGGSLLYGLLYGLPVPSRVRWGAEAVRRIEAT